MILNYNLKVEATSEGENNESPEMDLNYIYNISKSLSEIIFKYPLIVIFT
jgi:hypothetical protein